MKHGKSLHNYNDDYYRQNVSFVCFTNSIANHYQAGLLDTIFALLHVLPKEQDSYRREIVFIRIKQVACML